MTNEINNFLDAEEEEQALQSLRSLLLRIGMPTQRKNPKHHTLLVYPHGYHSYPLLNPRFEQSAAHLEPRFARPCVVFTVCSKRRGEALDRQLSAFASDERCWFAADAYDHHDGYRYHGHFILPVEIDPEIDLSALREPLLRLKVFLQRHT